MPANYQSRITLWDLRISNQEFVSFILRILRLFFLAITKKKKKKKKEAYFHKLMCLVHKDNPQS